MARMSLEALAEHLLTIRQAVKGYRVARLGDKHGEEGTGHPTSNADFPEVSSLKASFHLIPAVQANTQNTSYSKGFLMLINHLQELL